MDPQVVRTRIAQIQAEFGLAEASRRLNLRREVVLRLASGAPVREGTMLLAAQRLGLLSAPPLAISSTPNPRA